MQIEDWAVSFSPLLSTMISTNNAVAKDTDGYPMIDVQPAIMRQYIRYLHGKPFMMNQKLERLVSFMGHDERNGKLPGLWVAELRDAWTRHHFDTRELWKNPEAGMVISHPMTPCVFSEGIYSIGRAAYGYKGRYYHNEYAQNDMALFSGRILCTTKRYDLFSHNLNDTFYLEQESKCIMEHKIWRSANDIALNHPVSMGMALSLYDGTMYMTHVCNWRIKHDTKRWMDEAWDALKTWCPFNCKINAMVYYYPKGCKDGTITSYVPIRTTSMLYHVI